MAETLNNRFALKVSLTEMRADITEQISRLTDRMEENATMQFVTFKTAGLEELKVGELAELN